MKGIFLGACLERHEMYDMDYNDNVDLQCPQKKECVQKQSHHSLSKNSYRQGGENVYIVIEKWLSKLHKILGESRS